jgi:hypothetical protein
MRASLRQLVSEATPEQNPDPSISIAQGAGIAIYLIKLEPLRKIDLEKVFVHSLVLTLRRKAASPCLWPGPGRRLLY